MIKDFLLSIINAAYARRPAAQTVNDSKLGSGKMFVITVAFNNLQIIKLQKRQLSKFLTDEHGYIVIDNSSNQGVAEKIKNFCMENKIPYFKTPRQNLFRGSVSHGLALNWAVRNIVQKYPPRAFGFIDHDIFPIGKISIAEKLQGRKFYGHRQERGSDWYLWPGFSFFNMRLIGKFKFDFLPKRGLDTGGGNLLEESSGTFTSNTYFDIEKYGLMDNPPKIQLLDSWLHLHRFSGWADEISGFDKLEKILRDYEEVYNKDIS